jgi:hypothetical protein
MDKDCFHKFQGTVGTLLACLSNPYNDAGHYCPVTYEKIVIGFETYLLYPVMKTGCEQNERDQSAQEPVFGSKGKKNGARIEIQPRLKSNIL